MEQLKLQNFQRSRVNLNDLELLRYDTQKDQSNMDWTLQSQSVLCFSDTSKKVKRQTLQCYEIFEIMCDKGMYLEYVIYSYKSIMEDSPI